MLIKLLSQGENERLEFHVDQLEALLSAYKSHHVAVVSIAGKVRTGKSFLINWLLKYMGSNGASWLAAGRLDGFPFGRGRSKLTDGIDIWCGEVIEFTHDQHGPSILLVLDTQGIFSAEDDFAESVAVFAISLILSSVQVYNLRGALDRLQLDQLRLFASFGAMLTREKAHSPFQRLILAIRDWELDDECFGLKGGAKMLVDFMETLEETDEGNELRNAFGIKLFIWSCNLNIK